MPGAVGADDAGGVGGGVIVGGGGTGVVGGGVMAGGGGTAFGASWAGGAGGAFLTLVSLAAFFLCVAALALA